MNENTEKEKILGCNDDDNPYGIVNCNTVLEIPRDETLDMNEEIDKFNVDPDEMNDYGQKSSFVSVLKQKLYNDEILRMKECARCHKILSYEEFHTVGAGDNTPRHCCKKCTNEIRIIRFYKKKIKVVNAFGGKCIYGGEGIEWLPAISFHHLNPEIKTTKYGVIRRKSVSEIISTLKQEKGDLVCLNHHSMIHAIYFEKYKHLILKKELFRLTPLKINQLIFREINEISDLNFKHFIREEIRFFIKKRYIIEKHFGGVCIACKNVSVYSDLPALEFHHREPKEIEDNISWNEIKFKSIDQIIKILLEQDCVCLCANCHAFYHSKFSKFAKEILPKKIKVFETINQKEFLQDIINLTIPKILNKYNLGSVNTLYKWISNILGSDINTVKKARGFLEKVNIEDIIEAKSNDQTLDNENLIKDIEKIQENLSINIKNFSIKKRNIKIEDPFNLVKQEDYWKVDLLILYYETKMGINSFIRGDVDNLFNLSPSISNNKLSLWYEMGLLRRIREIQEDKGGMRYKYHFSEKGCIIAENIVKSEPEILEFALEKKELLKNENLKGRMFPY
ncbi:MAG: hypothetical protein EU532_09620 [Promethearchaeota archaeon]|nr:MAG: hypothetical protein EU532_09620 [Candidatus Lokiarchaeota archaeon]